MQRSYESVVIFTPVLPEDDVKRAIGEYQKLLQTLETETVHEEFWGLKQLAYPIRKKTTGFYFLTEYKANPQAIAKLELQLKRDERVLRFMTTKLDKYAVEYNLKRRQGLVGPNRKSKPSQEAQEG